MGWDSQREGQQDVNSPNHRPEEMVDRMTTDTDRAISPPRWVRWWVVATVACVFGPYLVSGVRTEQVALYGSAAVAPFIAPRPWRWLRPGLFVLVPWTLYVAVAAIASFAVDSRMPVATGSLVAGLDNAMLPLATLTVTACWMQLLPARVLIRLTSWVMVGALSLNSVLAVCSSYVGLDQMPILPGFWSAAGAGESVAELAATNGRFSGLFNQPAEAGVAYCLGAFCLVYLVNAAEAGSRATWLPCWVLIMLGGLMTQSKIFMVGGLAITVVLVLVGQRHRLLLAVSAFVTVVGAIVVGTRGWLGDWGTAGTVGWYAASIEAGDSWLYTISSGRFGRGGDAVVPSVPTTENGETVIEPGGLLQLGKLVLNEHPVFGVGARGLSVSYDSTWIETIIVAGAVGALLILVVHAGLVLRWVRLRTALPRDERFLAAALVLLVWGSSLGMPSLTGNRESSMLWIMLGLLLVFRVRDPQPPVAAHDHRAAHASENRDA
jgi:hypothetical protein